MRIQIKVVTRSSKNRVAGGIGGRLKVCVTAPPEKGRANALVVETLAAHFGVPERSVRVVGGERSSLKEVEIDRVGT